MHPNLAHERLTGNVGGSDADAVDVGFRMQSPHTERDFTLGEETVERQEADGLVGFAEDFGDVDAHGVSPINLFIVPAQASGIVAP
jgi:hypothetical protein